ncbi:MAG TPA: thioredoxin domain-containing protein [Pyrinomonadaceae bacterium]|nr:thioredoxin domain-containing protein [Pyrinomonadaceae bacterium]
MSRLIIAMVASLVALATSVAGQTSTGTVTKTETAGTTRQATPQLNTTAEDCACESQALPEDLAIVNGVKIGRRDIEKATLERVNQLKGQVVQARKQELDLQINSKLLAIEARKRGINPTKLLELEVIAKVKEPTQAEAQVVYDQNKARIEGTFDEARDDILRYLREQRRADEAKRFANGLRQSIETKVEIAQSTSPPNKMEADRVLATVNGEPITRGDIEASLRPLVFAVQQQLYQLRKNELDLTINDSLLNQEAQKRKITTTLLLDTEVKPKQITDEDARAFYTENKERVSAEFEATKDSIIRYLQQIEVRRAERVFVEKLRAASTIQTFLVAPEPPVFAIATADQPSKGNAGAPVTIIAFTDLQCPACAETHQTLERLVKEYGTRIRLVARDFPLVQHSQAFKAAEAAEAAREQGKYWEYVKVLLSNQSALEVSKLKDYASELNLDRSRFDQALVSGKFADTVQRDIQDGLRLGVDSTPTLFLNGRRVADMSYDALKAIIDTALKTLPRKTSAGE